MKPIQEVEDQRYQDGNKDKQNIGFHRRVAPPGFSGVYSYALLSTIASSTFAASSALSVAVSKTSYSSFILIK